MPLSVSYVKAVHAVSSASKPFLGAGYPCEQDDDGMARDSEFTTCLAPTLQGGRKPIHMTPLERHATGTVGTRDL